MRKHHVTLLSYYGYQVPMFAAMARALPATTVRVTHRNIYALTPASLCQRYTDATALPPERVEEITLPYRRRQAARGIACDSFAWRVRTSVRVNQWYHLFLRVLRATDLLVVWNGYAIPVQAAIQAARELGVQVLHGENGVLPGTMALDPCGINYQNALTGKTAAFYDAISTEPAKVTQLFEMPLPQRPLRAAHVRAERCDDGAPLPPRYVFFPMQVHDDSQILLFSPRFPDMATAVTAVAHAVASYNARTGDNVRLVVKEHPSDYGRVDYTPLRRAFPDAFFLRTTPVREIIGDALAVITINSAVGVEGLFHLRPVITLGNAFYNVPGVTRQLGDDDLATVLGEVIDHPVHRERITKFLYFLRYDYLLPLTPKITNPQAYAPATQRILDTLEGRLWWAR